MSLKDLKNKLMADSNFAEAYKKLEPEFTEVRKTIAASIISNDSLSTEFLQATELVTSYRWITKRGNEKKVTLVHTDSYLLINFWQCVGGVMRLITKKFTDIDECLAYSKKKFGIVL